jgi:hypothetical protein
MLEKSPEITVRSSPNQFYTENDSNRKSRIEYLHEITNQMQNEEEEENNNSNDNNHSETIVDAK